MHAYIYTVTHAGSGESSVAVAGQKRALSDRGEGSMAQGSLSGTRIIIIRPAEHTAVMH